MKKLLAAFDKIEIKFTTILLFVVSFLCGYIKPLSLYFMIAFIHEFCHFLMCIVLKVKVNKFIVLPFGACLKVEEIDNINSIKQILIYIAGPASFFINLLWLSIFTKLEIINYVNYKFIFDSNIIMCLLNLLPVFPLDGYVIIKAILTKIFPYKTSIKISLIISVIFFLLFALYNIKDFQPMVLFFLLFEQIKYILTCGEIYKKFLINKTIQKKEKKYKVINDYNMFKDINNYKLENDGILNDKSIAIKELKKYF